MLSVVFGEEAHELLCGLARILVYGLSLGVIAYIAEGGIVLYFQVIKAHISIQRSNFELLLSLCEEHSVNGDICKLAVVLGSEYCQLLVAKGDAAVNSLFGRDIEALRMFNACFLYEISNRALELPNGVSSKI